ncbi:hypothetical protein [Streptomyces niveus]|uniref:hypothetical protein n=1 Tax=Streptomyces niveus TaxID=193462 RepID=UPI00343143B6
MDRVDSARDHREHAPPELVLLMDVPHRGGDPGGLEDEKAPDVITRGGRSSAITVWFTDMRCAAHDARDSAHLPLRATQCVGGGLQTSAGEVAQRLTGNDASGPVAASEKT